MNCLWKIRNATNNGAVVINVPALIVAHSTPASDIENILNPTVSGLVSTEFVIIKGLWLLQIQ